MSTLRETIKDIVPTPFLNLAGDIRDSLQHAAEWPSVTFHPWRRESIHRLADLKDIHRGGRCFIIGNGPSLKKTDISPLRDEYTFGMNRIYLLFSKLGFTTTFLVSVNNLVIEQCAAEFRALEIFKFFSWRARNLLYPDGVEEPDKYTHFLHTTYTSPKFAPDARKRLWEGATVTYVCLQLAFHMGFEQVILIGVDHNFVTQGKPNTTVVSQADDVDHFHTEYFGKGFRWQLPDLPTSEAAYHMAH